MISCEPVERRELLTRISRAAPRASVVLLFAVDVDVVKDAAAALPGPGARAQLSFTAAFALCEHDVETVQAWWQRAQDSYPQVTLAVGANAHGLETLDTLEVGARRQLGGSERLFLLQGEHVVPGAIALAWRCR